MYILFTSILVLLEVFEVLEVLEYVRTVSPTKSFLMVLEVLEVSGTVAYPGKTTVSVRITSRTGVGCQKSLPSLRSFLGGFRRVEILHLSFLFSRTPLENQWNPKY